MVDQMPVYGPVCCEKLMSYRDVGPPWPGNDEQCRRYQCEVCGKWVAIPIKTKVDVSNT